MKLLISGILLSLLLLGTPRPAFAHAGCCSKHGGVFGCGCADGTPLSSTCLPYYPECSSTGTSVSPSPSVTPFTPMTPQMSPGVSHAFHPSITNPPVSPAAPTASPTRAPTPKSAKTGANSIHETKPTIFSSFLSFLTGLFGISRSQNTAPAIAEGVQPQTGHCSAIHVNTADPEAYLPDPHCTPGSLNPAVTQTTIASTICMSGYTKTIRPPISYTEKLKREQIAAYGYLDTRMSDYEEDHLISLELGGNPTDPKNLWPEPKSSPNEKDIVEDYLHKQVCSGAIPLAQAQKEISTDWYTIFMQIR